MNTLFRADSSSTIGTGHIMRDLVLASQYKEAHIIFASQELEGNINQKILDAGYTLEILSSHKQEELDAIIEKYAADMLVIDHYGIDYDYEKKLKEKYPKLTLMVLDDTYEKHHCDILLNHNISADVKRYKGLVPQGCELRCGSRYMLLREEFKKAKKLHKMRNTKIRTVFLAMGGADHSNINTGILKVLKQCKNLQIELVTTQANQHLKELQQYCKYKKWIHLHINANNIAVLMKKSDFAIITPSVTMNEISYLHIPFIGIQTADNQRYMYSYLKKRNFLAMSKFSPNRLKNYISKLIVRNKHEYKRY